jgi:hypothetical protein
VSTRKILGAGAIAAVLVAGGLWAGTSIAGNDGEPQASGKVLIAEPIVAQPAQRQAGTGAKGKKRKKPIVRYFQAAVATVPPEGQGIVQPISCPPGQGEPIAAGAQTTVGLVINYLSRINPETQAPDLLRGRRGHQRLEPGGLRRARRGAVREERQGRLRPVAAFCARARTRSARGRS